MRARDPWVGDSDVSAQITADDDIVTRREGAF